MTSHPAGTYPIHAHDRVMASTKPSKVCKLQLPEVYDIARKVGEEFQHIIGEFGGRCVATLVPTVVEALEYLEIYVEEYQTLQTRNYKLLLENDSLAMEREQRIRLATENEELLQQQQRGEREVTSLSHRVDRLQLKNEALLRKIDKLKHEHQNSPREAFSSSPSLVHGDNGEEMDEEDALNGLPQPASHSHHPGRGLTWRHHSDTDMMEGPRMHRRLSQVDSELTTAKRRLNILEQSCERLNLENCKLKAQLEEYKAEAALKSIQECADDLGDQEEKDTPRFYKRDLLAVLRERNELKEELDTLRDELAMARRELREHEVHDMGYRKRGTTTVREILDTLTVSLKIDVNSQNVNHQS